MTADDATALLRGLACYGTPQQRLTAGWLARKATGGWSLSGRQAHTGLLRRLHAAAEALDYQHPDWIIAPRDGVHQPLTFIRRHQNV